MADFEMVESKRISRVSGNSEVFEPEVIDKPNVPANNGSNPLANAAAEHMGDMIKIVSDIVDIQRIKVQTDADIRRMEEARKSLIAEADVYVRKTNADADNAVKRMEAIRNIMNDFYKYGSEKISSDDFCKIITTVINETGTIK